MSSILSHHFLPCLLPCPLPSLVHGPPCIFLCLPISVSLFSPHRLRLLTFKLFILASTIVASQLIVYLYHWIAETIRARPEKPSSDPVVTASLSAAGPGGGPGARPYGHGPNEPVCEGQTITDARACRSVPLMSDTTASEKNHGASEKTRPASPVTGSQEAGMA
eukprot:762853-Hanusia_phi.AAC.7